MESQRRITDESVICVRTEVRCTDRKIGALVGRYLRNELSAERKLVFERHMSECFACDSTVFNWENLKFAAASLRGASRASKTGK
jgi:anti-sigma factor RsiW